MNNNKLNHWLLSMKLNHPLVIAGPCSAETEEQVLETAHQLKKTDATVFRAGIWKPRTRPGHFEGVGKKGLKWLQRAKQETGLLLSTEVANAQHVEEALKHDVDILWIGARSTVSPFIVQEIADALKGVDIPILIKNPVSPDFQLWLGAVERLYKAEIRNVGVIHRGFASYQKSVYRNDPEWQVALEMQAHFPNLPLILDPSHIAGNRNLIFDLCQTALDLNYDGFMIEAHRDPNEAWSDASQQITPQRLFQITTDLIIRKKTDESQAYKRALNSLRTQIDLLDDTLIDTLAKRMQVAENIGELKKVNNVSVLQSKRWNHLLDKTLCTANKKGLGESFVKKVFKAIHMESIAHQENVFKSEWIISRE